MFVMASIFGKNRLFSDIIFLEMRFDALHLFCDTCLGVFPPVLPLQYSSFQNHSDHSMSLLRGFPVLALSCGFSLGTTIYTICYSHLVGDSGFLFSVD